ncbi:MAG TPA: Rieske 2Fe-2S domain-containing protein [Pyrinomonadaceae bacterium]|nr:Rieske 2Fe-2S domain-containing protein [Pyrinomonadaceae bacterium]
MSTNNLSETIRRVMDHETARQSDETDVRQATAPYQKDFPYEREEEAQVTRREFCNFLGLTSTALFLGAAGFAAQSVLRAENAGSFAPARIEGADTLAPNTALNFHYPTEKDSAILIRTESGEYYAYGQQCTHLSCPVYYERQQQRLECPCHEGAFDIATGKVLYGPPPRPLDMIQLEMRDGAVWAVNRKPAGDEHAI